MRSLQGCNRDAWSFIWCHKRTGLSVSPLQVIGEGEREGKRLCGILKVQGWELGSCLLFQLQSILLQLSIHPFM